MPSRNNAITKTNPRRKTKKKSFLRRKFLKIPIWVWLVLLIIGLFNSSGDDPTIVPNNTSTSNIETISTVAPENKVEAMVQEEANNNSIIETANIPSTNQPTTVPVIIPEPVPTETPVPTNDPTQYVLKQGDKNDDVRQLQKRLIALGYLTGSADGDFGPKTAKAVLAYQKAAGISATGECDYYTYKSLTSKDAPAAPKPIATEKPVAKSNDNGMAYIGNKNTKKFHYASCSSVDDMKESNKVPFSSRDAAISKNYVPCKRCHP